MKKTTIIIAILLCIPVAPHANIASLELNQASNFIVIDGNFTETAAANSWAGAGIPGNPYIITGLSFTMQNYDDIGIMIMNTADSFIIQGNSFTGVYGQSTQNGTGIYLDNVTNGIITTNTFTTLQVGIDARNIDFPSNSIESNTFTDIYLGIYFIYADYNNITGNTIQNTQLGISFQVSNFNNISENIISDSNVGFQTGDTSWNKNSFVGNTFTNNADAIEGPLRYANFTDNVITGSSIFRLTPTTLIRDFTYNATAFSGNSFNGARIDLYQDQTNIQSEINVGALIIGNCSDIVITHDIPIIIIVYSNNTKISGISSSQTWLYKITNGNISNSMIAGLTVTQGNNFNATGSELWDYVSYISTQNFIFSNNFNVDEAMFTYSNNGSISQNELTYLYFQTYVHDVIVNDNVISAYGGQYAAYLDMVNCTFTGNKFIGASALGVYLTQYSDDNYFTMNEFISNGLSKQIQDISTGTNNTFFRNSYDDHLGPDANNDGIVDTPYTFTQGNSDPEPLATTSHTISAFTVNTVPDTISDTVTISWTASASNYQFVTKYDVNLVHADGISEPQVNLITATSYVFNGGGKIPENGLKFEIIAYAGNLMTSAVSNTFDFPDTSNTDTNTNTNTNTNTDTNTGSNNPPPDNNPDGGLNIPVNSTAVLIGVALIPILRKRRKY